jgi:hypothetical protein
MISKQQSIHTIVDRVRFRCPFRVGPLLAMCGLLSGARQ